LWLLGYPDQALERIHEALTLAHELAHPYSLGFALGSAAWLHQFRRERQAAQERAEVLIALTTEQEFAQWLADGTIIRGWALAEQGKGEEGTTQMHQGLAALRVTRAEFEQPYWLARMAEAYGKGGQAEEGLSVLAEALAIVDKTGVRFYEAELYRLKGELTLQQFKVQGSKFKVEESSESGVWSLESEAEEYFQKAIAIAKRQQAKSLELRATTSLARLWQRQGKQHEARNMLSEIYNWFTEGFDTKDLQEAKALLEELSHFEGGGF
jgi:predicted ATPase